MITTTYHFDRVVLVQMVILSFIIFWGEKWGNFWAQKSITNKLFLFTTMGNGSPIYELSPYSSVRDSSDGIATRYELDGPGIESRLGRNFPRPSRPTQPTIKWVKGLSRSKGAGAWCWPPTPSNAEIKERVELNLYSPYESAWTVLGWTLPLPLPYSSYGTHYVCKRRDASKTIKLRILFSVV
jgi:hypothetical protein